MNDRQIHGSEVLDNEGRSLEDYIKGRQMQPEQEEKDPGAHYRRSIGGVQADPFRIAKAYEMDCPALFTILKKCLMAGRRGFKDKRQDLMDIRNAADRELEIMNEDGE